MKACASFFRLRFLAGLQYRAAAWAGMATQAAWGGMTILMFHAFYRSGQNQFPMEFADLSSYIWLQQAFLALYMTWFFDDTIFESITSGSVAYELCRPLDLYNMWFIQNTATRCSKAMLRCGPILLLAALLPKPFGMSLPASPAALGLGIISMGLGLLVLVSFSMLVYISSFFTLSSRGIRILLSSVLEFFCGGILPLPFFPDAIQPLMNALPFASIQNTPFLIYTGHYSGSQITHALVLQLGWLLVFLILGKAWMGRAMKKVIVQGG